MDSESDNEVNSDIKSEKEVQSDSLSSFPVSHKMGLGLCLHSGNDEVFRHNVIENGRVFVCSDSEEDPMSRMVSFLEAQRCSSVMFIGRPLHGVASARQVYLVAASGPNTEGGYNNQSGYTNKRGKGCISEVVEQELVLSSLDALVYSVNAALWGPHVPGYVQRIVAFLLRFSNAIIVLPRKEAASSLDIPLEYVQEIQQK